MKIPETRSILFVDDQPEILAGLKRMLWAERREWELLYSEGCDDAARLLEQRRIDIVVTDLRMPRADGVQLLDILRRQHPGCVRIVLSGYAASETVLRSVGLAHQFLAKPCTAESLKSTIQKALFVQNLLESNPGLQELVGRIESLPSVPSLYLQVARELQSEEPSLQRVGKIVSRDPGMTAKTLQLVNSAFFGLPKQIDDAGRAVFLLGLDITRALVLSVEIFSQFERTTLGGVVWNSLWRHSWACAQLARRLAQLEWPENPKLHERAYTTGLLHDVGKLILGAYNPDEYREVAERARIENLSVTEAEEDFWGTGHPAVGAFLLGLWGLPLDLVQAVRWHHAPDEASTQEGKDLIRLIHAADALVAELGYSSGNPGSVIAGKLGEGADEVEFHAQIDRWRAFASKLLDGSPIDGEESIKAEHSR